MQTLLLCTALGYFHTTSCTQRDTYHHRPGKGQRELHALGWPIAEYRHHVLPPSPSPIYLGGYFVKVSRRIHQKWNWLLHPKLTEDPLGMMPLHYPKVDQWHLDLPNMLLGGAIRR